MKIIKLVTPEQFIELASLGMPVYSDVSHVHLDMLWVFRSESIQDEERTNAEQYARIFEYLYTLVDNGEDDNG